jgi:Ca2+-binding RTX toxin-like protein
MAAFATTGLEFESTSSTQFRTFSDFAIVGDWVLQQVDNDLTAIVSSTSQGAQIYVDGSDYNDHITVESMNTTTGVVTIRLEQWTGGNQFSNGTLVSAKTVTLNAGRPLDPYAPVYIAAGNGNDKIANATAGPMSIFAGDGGDFVTGGSAGEYIDGGPGFDTIYANGGNDTVTAREGDDTVWGGTGYDTIYGDDGKDSLHGGEDHDTVVGNAGDDVLYGENGSDRLYGMTGNDYARGDEVGQAVYDYISGGEGDDDLDGGGGHDTIDGDTGNDTIRGGLGNDILHGGDDNDLVLGENGQDKVYGDNGNDGVFGGATDLRDTLWGGAGADRLLSAAYKGSGQTANREDTIMDATSIDARPAFVHGYPMTVTIGSTPTTYTTSYWWDGAILRADAVLALLHAEGNGTKLLKRSGGGDMGIVLHGGTNRGFNDGWIHMTYANNQFGGSDEDLRGYLLHEIGHNWQGSAFKANGIDFWNRFKNISAWTSVNPNDPANYTLSTNEGRGNRWYLTNSGFVSNYAKTNENEDFAESFAAYFSARARWNFYNGTGSTGAPAKMIVFLDWAARIAAGG